MKNNTLFKYISLDFLAASVVWLLFYLFRRVQIDYPLLGKETFTYFSFSYMLLLSAGAYVAICIFVHYLTGYYNRNVSKSRLIEFFTSFSSSIIITIISFFTMLIDDGVDTYRFYYTSVMVLFVLQFSFTYSLRYFLTTYIFSRYAKGKITVPLLIVGTGKLATDITYGLARSKRYIGRNLVGYVSVGGEVLIPSSKYLGTVEDIERIVCENNIEEVVIALDEINENKIFTIVNKLLPLTVNVMFAPSMYEIMTGRVALGDIYSEPLVSIRSLVMPPWQQSVKRIFDVVVSATMLVLLMPVYLYLAIMVKLDSKGGVFYLQERVGYAGKAFNIVKFRTMRLDAESSEPKLTSKGDERITRYGAVMRKYRLDELPQLWNILKGDMSIVGPRPERAFFIEKVEKIAPYYCLLYGIRPGLLSWGPIKVGYADNVDKMVERLRYDIIYMNNMNIVTDLKIMFYSFDVIFNGKGQ